MELPTDLPPYLSVDEPFDIWITKLVNGVARHIFSWKLDGMNEATIIIEATRMIHTTCTLASYEHQRLLEVSYGKDRQNTYNILLRAAADWINPRRLDLARWPVIQPRDWGSNPIKYELSGPPTIYNAPSSQFSRNTD